jgi:UDP-N-acetylglucosamine--N-acetylmuramyl-(pentapeptide) pyrophosphoryl-undecaprenol N-acetylglucosamine transferase
MGSESPVKVLLVAEGSGGHLVPALEVAHMLAKRGARIKLWYAARPQAARFVSALTHEASSHGVDVDPIPTDGVSTPLGKLWRCGQLWSRAHRCFDTFAPDVVVGFGGWVSAPVVLAARLRPHRISALLHEQNVVMGRANRFLAPWVDRVALSFHPAPGGGVNDPRAALGNIPAVITGLPIRPAIGTASRAEAAARFGFSPHQPTLLILGGSQGARAINRVMIQVAGQLSQEERTQWQILHLTGASDDMMVREAYAASGLTAWVASFLDDMGFAYAHADLAIARAGASTIAELARCGIPPVLIPYPFAGGHQRANAKLVEACGGGVVIEESHASPGCLLGVVRHLFADARLREAMGAQMQALHASDAAARLTDAIMELARSRAARGRP